MKSLVLLVAMSLMLVGATVVVAVPSQAEAAGAQWCGAAGCFQGNGQCERESAGDCCKTKPWLP